MKLRDFGAEDVDSYVNAKIDDEELSDKTVSNHVALLSAMLRMADGFKVPWILHAPKLRKPKVALFGTDYQWLRSDDEVRRFLAAARAEDEHVFVFYALAIFSGMRAGELAALEWPDINIGLQDKLLGQVRVALLGQHVLRDGGSLTLTTGIIAQEPARLLANGTAINASIEGFVLAAAIELPRGVRINAVSPSILTESKAAYGAVLPGLESVPAARVALAYARSVEGSQTGRIYRVWQ